MRRVSAVISVLLLMKSLILPLLLLLLNESLTEQQKPQEKKQQQQHNNKRKPLYGPIDYIISSLLPSHRHKCANAFGAELFLVHLSTNYLSIHPRVIQTVLIEC